MSLTIYKASAGSGKTFQLAYWYLKLTLGAMNPSSGQWHLCQGRELDNRHRHILAITFTNKATEEMKERILDKMEVLSRCTERTKDYNDPYIAMLMDDLHCSREQLQESAKKALEQLLYDFDEVHVSTIDAFFQTVLRTFGREVNLDGDYEVEIDDRQALITAVEEVIGSLDRLDASDAKYRALAPIFKGIMERYLEEGQKVNVFKRDATLRKTLKNYVATALNEDFAPYTQPVIDYLDDLDQGKSARSALYRDAVYNHKRSLEGQLTSPIKAYQAKWEPRGLGKKGTDFNGYFANFIARLKDDPIEEYKKQGTYFVAALNNENKIFNKPPKKAPLTQTEREQAYDEYVAIIKDVDSKCAEIKFCTDVLTSLESLTLLGEALAQIQQYRANNNLVLLSDTNALLSHIIGSDNQQEVPFVYERLGMEIHHLLIDEFQDTSSSQWSNLGTLVTNALGEGHDNLIIGDEKQSIYRFRNADSELLHHKVQQQLKAFPVEVRGNTPEQNTNHRSRTEIVRFNNTLFEQAASRARYYKDCTPPGDPYYSNVLQAPVDNPDNQGGYVHIELYYKDDKDKEDTITKEAFVYGRMVEAISGQLKAGYRPCDIAILVNRNQDGANIIQYCLQHGAPFKLKSDEALYLRSSSAVMYVMSVLSSLLTGNPDEAEQQLASAKHLTQQQTDAVMDRFAYFLARQQNPDRSEAIAQAINYTLPGPRYKPEIDKYRPSTILSLIELVIHEGLTPDQAREHYGYLAALQDQAAEMCQRGNSDLYAFVKAWDTTGQYKWTVAAASGDDAVNIMTIHKAKGLQWECVHLPHLDWSYKEGSQWYYLRPPVKVSNPLPVTDFPPFVAEDIIPPVLKLDNSEGVRASWSPIQAQAMDNDRKMRSDELNKAYVACTRPVSELYIWANTKHTADGIYTELLSAFDAMAGEVQPDNLHTTLAKTLGGDPPLTATYTAGAPTTPRKPKVSEQKTNPILADNPMSYEVKLYDGKGNITRIDDPDDPDNIVKRYGGRVVSGDQKRRGTVMHAILQRINSLEPEDIEDAFNKVTYQMFKVGDEEREQYRQLLARAFDPSRPEIQRWFDNAAITERNIYDPKADSGPEKLNDARNQRPDRVVFCPDGHVEIVDYKFTDKVEDSHVNQISRYRRLLQAMGHADVRAYLWYPLLNVIKSV